MTYLPEVIRTVGIASGAVLIALALLPHLSNRAGERARRIGWMMFGAALVYGQADLYHDPAILRPLLGAAAGVASCVGTVQMLRERQRNGE